MELKDKVVLITGATGGIGKSLADQLANEGCKLALFARRKEKLEQHQKLLKEKNVQCIIQNCDVTKKQDVFDAIKHTVKTYGQIDIAIQTAGVLVPNPIETFNSDIIKNSIDINFMGDVYFIEHLLPVMKEQKSGVIASISTLPDRRGVPGWGAYGSSKAAISWLMESLRAEAKQKYNIDIITIKPGSVESPMIAEFPRKGALSPEKAATIIIRGIKKRKKIIQFPFLQVALVRIADMFPNFAYDRIPLEQQKGPGYPEAKEERKIIYK